MEQTTVRLNCPACQDKFFADLEWWWLRLQTGARELCCRVCDPDSWDGHP